ncbi:flagellar hook-length control protein FliK [Candidatus Acidulodesulfobacterium sp. H_13]|uniref:flagellar hook-length control protein FliK n=1 Tax=Candidatus Acidulodesulfobacterium sp. H_13 TaxID=3395470 RepID=UPI003AF5721A
MLNNLTSNLSVDASLSPANFGGGVSSLKGYVSLSGSESYSGRNTGFGEALNDSIKNNNSGDDSAVDTVSQKIASSTNNNSTDLSGLHDADAKDRHKKSGVKIRNNNNKGVGHVPYFIGNTNTTMSVSVKKKNNSEESGRTNVKSEHGYVDSNVYSNGIGKSINKSKNLEQKINDIGGKDSKDIKKDKAGLSDATGDKDKKIADSASDKNNKDASGKTKATHANSKKSIFNGITERAHSNSINSEIANAFDLAALNGEAKSVLSGMDGKNSESKNGNADIGNNNNKILDFIDAGFVQGSGTRVNNSTPNGNFPGLNLSSGHINDVNESGGETYGSAAVNSVVFMLKNSVQSTTITLTPPSLGTVKIDISINNANATANSLNSSASNGSIAISMLAQNEAAKNMLQSAFGSLQNTLKNQGFSSINLNVSSGSDYNNNRARDKGGKAFRNTLGNNFYNVGTSTLGIASSASDGFAYRNPDALIDYFV